MQFVLNCLIRTHQIFTYFVWSAVFFFSFFLVFEASVASVLSHIVLSLYCRNILHWHTSPGAILSATGTLQQASLIPFIISPRMMNWRRRVTLFDIIWKGICCSLTILWHFIAIPYIAEYFSHNINSSTYKQSALLVACAACAVNECFALSGETCLRLFMGWKCNRERFSREKPQGQLRYFAV